MLFFRLDIKVYTECKAMNKNLLNLVNLIYLFESKLNNFSYALIEQSLNHLYLTHWSNRIFMQSICFNYSFSKINLQTKSKMLSNLFASIILGIYFEEILFQSFRAESYTK